MVVEVPDVARHPVEVAAVVGAHQDHPVADPVLIWDTANSAE
jgi:hypothetical protein